MQIEPDEMIEAITDASEALYTGTTGREKNVRKARARIILELMREQRQLNACTAEVWEEPDDTDMQVLKSTGQYDCHLPERYS